MATVKGSKQEKMIVVPHRPMQTLMLRAGVVLTLALVALGAYWFGHLAGVNQNGDARAERDMVRVQLLQAENENNYLRQQVVNIEQAGLMDKQALEDVQSTLLGYQEQIAQLEEDVLFYKQIMSPENDETGMVIGKLDLIQEGAPNEVRYRLELKQMGNNDQLITGFVNVNVLGMQDRQEVSIPLRSLSEEVNVLDVKLQFRYFQNIEGVMVLPEDFVAEKVQILAVSEAPTEKTVQKSFGWLVE